MPLSVVLVALMHRRTEASVGMNIGLNSNKGQFAWERQQPSRHATPYSSQGKFGTMQYLQGSGLRFAAILLRRTIMITTKTTHRTAAITRTIVGFIDVRSPYFLPSAVPLEPFPTVDIVTMTAGPEKQHKNTPKASQSN